MEQGRPAREVVMADLKHTLSSEGSSMTPAWEGCRLCYFVVEASCKWYYVVVNGRRQLKGCRVECSTNVAGLNGQLMLQC